MRTARRVLRLARQVLRHASHDDVPGIAAELAYQSFLALFPFLIFLAALGSLVARTLAVEDPTPGIVALVEDTMPPEAAVLLQAEVRRLITASEAPELLSIGLVLAIVFAAFGTLALMKAMNRAYGVQETRSFGRKLLVALGMTLLAGVAAVLAFFSFLAVQVFGESIADHLGLGPVFFRLVALSRWPGAFALLMLAAVLVYRLAPNVHMPVRRALPGAALFAAGWLLATWLFGLYVTELGAYGRIYGAVAGGAVLMIWFYLTAVLLLLGAELTEVLDEKEDPAAVKAERRRTRREAQQLHPPAPLAPA